MTQPEHKGHKEEIICPPYESCLGIVGGTDGDLEEKSAEISFPHPATNTSLQNHQLKVIKGWVVVLNLLL